MTPTPDRRSIRFPSSGHIWIPAHGRRAAAAGLSMHSPCRIPAVLAQRALFAAVLVAGPRVIPGERASWAPPLPDDEWAHVLREWEHATGGFDALSLYRRPQAGRSGFAALLLRAGRGVAFARVHPDAARVQREHDVLSALHRAGPATFRVAEPLAAGAAGDGGWMLTASVPNYPLAALRRAGRRAAVIDEIGALLGGILPRDADTPAHWTPAHGDFTPWNARTDLRGRVHVIDWEDAAYAPPGLDALYNALTMNATFGTPLPPTAPHEAQARLAAALAERISRDAGAAEEDDALRRALMSIPAV